MTFPVDEGWAVVAALWEYISKHPDAAHVARWEAWATSLDRELLATYDQSERMAELEGALERYWAGDDSALLDLRLGSSRPREAGR